MTRPRLLSTLLAAAFVASALVQASSCALETNGSMSEITDSCETAANCDDGNVCTTDSCTDNKVCAHAAVSDGPNPAQTPGDCKRIDCKDGAEVNVDDDADVPDDNEPCTNDTCAAGTPSNAPAMDGQACQRGNESGTCNMGVCEISCDAQNPCDDSNPCTDDFCNFATSICVFTNLDGLETPGATQVPGDCKQRLCVAGQDTPVTDDTDVPVDPNPCTDNVCTNGVPTNPDTAAGTYCAPGMPEVCDGNGACVECTLAEHCVDIVETDCTKRSCMGNQCVPMHLGNETTAGAASQTPGDCQRTVCNGTNGGVTDIVDNNDLPNDNKPCTIDTCVNGQETFTNASANTNCGGTNVCNATGQCVGCNSPTQCPGTDDFCKTRTCESGVCGFAYTGDGTVTPSGQTSMDCKVQVCDGAGNFVIRADTMDINPDGNPCTKDQCTAQGNPSYPNESSGFTCNVNGGDICNGTGQCKKSNGRNCSANAECAGNICVDGVCCNAMCGATCLACNVAGSLGTCTNVPSGTDDAPNCTGTNTCNGNGQCRKEQGVSCSANNECLSGTCVDGVCCDGACTGTCKACNVAGNIGKCVNIPGGQTDTFPGNTCTGANQCDGNGVCKKATGQGCNNNNSECVSGFCVDNICCSTDCTGTCRACNVSGSLGTCANVSMGTDDGGCSGTQTCDGAGACKTENGATCPSMPSQCLSGICADGVCCNATCNETCKACNVSGDEGLCINVPSGDDDNNATMTCTGSTQSCDGAGACKKDDGAACAAGSECTSNHCVDGVCCESACTTTCFQCNKAGSLGLCAEIVALQEDTSPMNACTGVNSCNGSGACKLDNGQDCAANADCASNYCHTNGRCQ